MQNEEIIRRAVALAQEEAREAAKDWLDGHVVCHPSEPTAAKLAHIDAEDAWLHFVDGRVLVFPLAEVFDPNRARDIAVRMLIREPS